MVSIRPKLSGIGVAAALLGSLLLVSPAPVAASGVAFPSVSANPPAVAAGQAVAGVFPCQQPAHAYHCYAPKQIQAAYGFNTLYHMGVLGQLRTIVIVDAFDDPYIVSDLATFDSTFGLPAPQAFNIIYPDGDGGYNPGWASEISLDVEWAHAIAPAATIDLVLALSNSDEDLNSATKYAVDNNLGDVISQSFGEAECPAASSDVSALHSIYQEATGKGITLLASSGDEGAAQINCSGTDYMRSASWPADDPLVTGVGGTSLTANLTTGAYGSERAWADNYSGGCFPANKYGCSGGGFSTVYPRPAYQPGVSGQGNHRGVPDVAYDGGVDGGVLACFDGTWYDFGGTSAGSPQWAGLVALTDSINHGRVGFINPALYQIAASPYLYASMFHDITSGNNNWPKIGSSSAITGYNTKVGWDAVTGLGTPKANVLVPFLAMNL
ncbi:MAG: S53 family peptidase [Candidatus Limnocylindrales bacterium]|jgi:subtilase family serine protease